MFAVGFLEAGHCSVEHTGNSIPVLTFKIVFALKNLKSNSVEIGTGFGIFRDTRFTHWMIVLSFTNP